MVNGGGSACVGLERLPGKPMAVDEDFIDLVNLPLAVAGRLARPER
jgi:hypothetical protein